MDDVRTIIASRPKDGVFDATAVTPGDRPNIEVKTLPTWAIVLIRATRVYCQAVVGLLTLKFTGADQALHIPMPVEFVAALALCMKAAVAVSFFTALQNSAELWRRLDLKFPELRG